MKTKTDEILKKRYLSKIRRKMKFPCKYKKEFSLHFKIKLEQFLQDSDATMQKAIQEFGTPKKVAEEYKRNIPPKDIIKHRWLSLAVKLFILIIFTVAVILTARYFTNEPGTLIESLPTEIT